MDQGVKTLILGCTHYPILTKQIAAICGPEIRLIDPAQSVASEIKKRPAESQDQAFMQVYLTDHASHFLEHAHQLLDHPENLKILSPKAL